MRNLKLRRFVAAFMAMWLVYAPVKALAGSMTLLGAGAFGSAAPAYTGPIDVAASPFGCWSLRACSSATRGQKVANVCNSTGGVDVGCADMFSDATTGNLVSQTISSITCPGANCTVKTLYQQTGSAVCTTACDLVQATVSARPTLTTSCGTLTKTFCMSFVAASSQQLTSASAISAGTSSQPVTIMAVGTGSGGASQTLINLNGASNTLLLYQSTSIILNAGSNCPKISITPSAWNVIIGLANGASSILNFNGVDQSSCSAGSNGWTGGKVSMGNDTFGDFANGSIVEMIAWPSSSPNRVNVCHNEFSYWGTATSC